MPDSSSKKLLVKLGISSTEWDKFVSSVKSKLAEMNAEAKKASEQSQVQTKKELELQKQKLKAAREELDIADRKIKQVQKTLDVQELDAQQKKEALAKAKSLLALEEAQLNLISKQKEYREVDLSKLRERIQLRKSELSLLEAQFRLEQPQVKLPAAGEMGATRMAQLQAGLQRAQATTAITQVRTEMVTQAQAYQQGLVETKKYVEDSIVLLTKRHQLLMEQIQQEKLAQEAAIAVQVKTGKLPAEEAAIQTQIIGEAVKKREILEQQAYDKEVTRLNSLVKKEEQSKIARMSSLKVQVGSAANRQQQAQVQAQIRENEAAFRSGEIRLKQYVATETTLQNQLAALRLRAIEEQKQAMIAAIQAEAAMGKKSAEEVALMTQKVEAQMNTLRIQAEQTRAAAISGLPKTGLIPTLTRGFEGSERGVGGILGGISGMAMYGGFGGGALGAIGGMVGSIAGPEAALLGGLIGGQVSEALDSIIEKIKSMGEAIEEATGKEAQLATEFEKLSRGQDTDPEGFIKKLREASHGLADNAQLYQIANNFMRLGMKLTTDQIVELTRVTVDLSRASGKTAEQGIQSLINASRTGYMRTLAFSTGISVQAMRMRGLSAAMDPLARQQLQLNEFLRLGKEQLEAMGPPLLTLPEFIKIYNTAHQELLHEFAAGVASSKGFSMALGALANIVRDTEESLLPLAATLGKDLGQGLYLLAPAIKLGVALFHLMWTEGKLLLSVVEKVVPAVYLLKKAFGGGDFKSFLDFVVRASAGMDVLTYRINSASLKLNEFIDIAKAAAKLDFGGIDKIRQDYANKQLIELQALGKRIQDDLQLAQEGDKDSAKIGLNVDNIALQKQMAKLNLQIATEEAKQRLEIIQQELDDEKDDLKQHYEQGLISLQEYVNGQKSILEQQRDAKIKELQETQALRIQEMEQEAVESHEPAQLTARKEQALREKTNTQILQIQRQTNRQELVLDNQLLQDKLAARRAYAAAVLQLQKQGAEQQKKELEDQLSGGEISPTDYIEKRKAIIAEELALTEQGLQAEYDASEKNEKAKETLNQKTVLAQMEAQKQLADLEMKQNDIVLKAIEGKYDAVEKYLQASLKLGELQTVQGGAGNQLGILQNLQEVVKQHIDALTNEMKRMQEEGTDPISNDYIKIITAITKAKEEQIQLNQEVAKMKDYLSPIADLMSAVENSFSHFPGITPINLSGPIKTLQEISKFTNQTAGQNPIQGMVAGLHSLFGKAPLTPKVSMSPMDQFKASVSSTTPTVNSFSNSLTTAIASLQGFSNKLQITAGEVPKPIGPPDVRKLPTTAQAVPMAVPAATTTVIKPISIGATAPTTGNLAPAIDTFKNAVSTASKSLIDFSNKVSGVGLNLPPNLGITPGQIAPPITETPGGGYTMSTTVSAPAPETTIPGAPDVSGLHLDTTNKNLDALNKQLEVAAGAKGNSGLKAFTDGLASTLSVMTSAIGTITGSQNAAGGAVGGGLAMAGVGSMIGKAVSSSAAAGPIGMAVGATVGIVSGAIVGSKQHAVNEQVKKLNTAFDNVVASLNNGSVKIGDAINQMVGIRQQAIDQLSGSKKGQKQLPSVLQGIDQQLVALQNQQMKILRDMFDQIATLAKPQALQPFVQQLSDIVKQYQQYLSAASGTPKFVARAHQYMQLALKNYIETMNKDLRSAQEDAIDNAIQLLDLEQQKATLISEEAQQEYDIMTQGVLTRQRTIAQTKIGEIEQLRYQRDLQLQQINEQIALAQYKLQAEQKIFSLATTRIGLEAQLLSLKEQDANLQIAQITALESVIGKVQQALASGIPWQYLGLPGTTGTGGALAILQGMTDPTRTPTNTRPGNLESQMSQMYMLRGRYAAGGFYRESL